MQSLGADPATDSPQPQPAVESRELRSWGGYPYYAANQQEAGFFLAVVHGALKVPVAIARQGEDENGAFVVATAGSTAAGTDAGSWVDTAIAAGDAIIADLASNTDVILRRTRDVKLASDITTASSKAMVMVEPSSGWQLPGAAAAVWLRVVGVVAGIGVVAGLAWYSLKGGGKMTSNARRSGLNNRERELWVMNDEGLYNWWKSSRLSMRNFIRENRAEIDQAILRALGR